MLHLSRFLIVFPIFLAFFAQGQKNKKQTASPQEGEYLVRFELDQPEINKAYLSLYEGMNLKIIDSTQFKGGYFDFKLSKASAKGFYNIRITNKQQFDIIFNDEDVHVKTRATVFSDSIKIVRSRENDIFYKYLFRLQQVNIDMMYWDELHERYMNQVDGKYFADVIKVATDSLYDRQERYIRQLMSQSSGLWINKFLQTLIYEPKVKQLLSKKDATAEEKQYLREHYFDGIDFSDERILHSRVFNDKYAYYLGYLTGDKSEDFVAAVDIIMNKAKVNEKVKDYTYNWLLGLFASAQKAEIVAYIQEEYRPTAADCRMEKAENVSASTKLNRIKNLVPEALSPVLDLPDMNGTTVSLRNTDAPAMVVLFWSSTCENSKKNILSMHEKLQPYIEKGLKVVAISLDTDKAKWNSFSQQSLPKFIHLSDLKGWSSQAVTAYGLKTANDVFLLDEVKKIKGKHLTEAELLELVKGLIK